MAELVCNGAMLTCSFAEPPVPVPLTVTPENKVMAGGQPAATIMDNVPMKNIPTFGMCGTQSNPAVAAATSAALGVPTPAPCVPVIPAPWVPGDPTVEINNMPALTSDSKCMCAYGGEISITSPGQVKVEAAG